MRKFRFIVFFILLFAFVGTSYFATSELSAKKEIVHGFEKEIENHWAKDKVNLLLRDHLIKGIFKDYGFSLDLDSKITRADFIMLITSVMKINTIPDKVHIFEDVPNNAYFKAAIDSLVSNNLITGYPDATIAPTKPLSRAEMAVMMYNFSQFLKKMPNKLAVKYNDISETDWYYKQTMFCKEYKIVNGYPGNLFLPSNLLTRAEAICVVANFYDVFIINNEENITVEGDVLKSLDFIEDSSVISNPERGWYTSIESNETIDKQLINEQGITLIQVKADFADFVNVPISQAKIQEIKSVLYKARKARLKVIFRAAYGFESSIKEPSDISITKNHILQLKEIFQEYEDVIYCVQAGLIGPWGEWHSSIYGDDPSLEARKTILFALLDSLPSSRMVQIRRPMFIRDIFANEPVGNILNQDSAFSYSKLSRTAYHNDAFLSTEDEMGTYVDPKYDRAEELEWLDNHNRYSVYGGETDFLSSLSDSENAIKEMKKSHMQFINQDFLETVIEKWKNTTFNDENTYDYISKYLGYRFVIRNAQISSKIEVGKVLHVVLNIENIGFGNLINPRNVEIILSNESKKFIVQLDEDPRTWLRENGVMKKDWYFKLPAQIETGKWNLYINLPDSGTLINKIPQYSIRFANQNTWNEDEGYNTIESGLTIESIDKSTSGIENSTDKSASDLNIISTDNTSAHNDFLQITKKQASEYMSIEKKTDLE